MFFFAIWTFFLFLRFTFIHSERLKNITDINGFFFEFIHINSENFDIVLFHRQVRISFLTSYWYPTFGFLFLDFRSIFGIRFLFLLRSHRLGRFFWILTYRDLIDSHRNIITKLSKFRIRFFLSIFAFFNTNEYQIQKNSGHNGSSQHIKHHFPNRSARRRIWGF